MNAWDVKVYFATIDDLKKFLNLVWLHWVFTAARPFLSL